MTAFHDNPDSVWLATAGQALATGPLRGDLKVDVAIVGAGFTGLRAALELVRAGTRVAVVDQSEIGWGAWIDLGAFDMKRGARGE